MAAPWEGINLVADLDGPDPTVLQISRRIPGWPVCPRCGEDELWSQDFMGWLRGPKPSYPPERGYDTFACYACGWTDKVTWLYPVEPAPSPQDSGRDVGAGA